MIYEPFEFLIFQKMISDAEAVFDVGSNFGWYSYIARNAEKRSAFLRDYKGIL